MTDFSSSRVLSPAPKLITWCTGSVITIVLVTVMERPPGYSALRNAWALRVWAVSGLAGLYDGSPERNQENGTV